MVQMHGLENILNPDFTPGGPDLIAFFGEQQKFLYAVLNNTLLTDIGNMIVCSDLRKYTYTRTCTFLYTLQSQPITRVNMSVENKE